MTRPSVTDATASGLPGETAGIQIFAPDTAWTTEYFGLAVDQLRRSGRRIDDEVLAHISPAHSENVNFIGAIEVDVEAELAQLGPTGYRPLRVRDTLF